MIMALVKIIVGFLEWQGKVLDRETRRQCELSEDYFQL